MDKLWRTVRCPSCGGHGLREAVEGAVECSECEGSGGLWIRPSGHVFQYPGGPAAGMWSKYEYERGTPFDDTEEATP